MNKAIKYTIAGIAMLLLPLFASAQWSDEKINTSFIDHSAACMFVTLGTTITVDYIATEIFHKEDWRYSKVIGFAVGIAVGMIKEFFEDYPDQIDLIADFTGCCVGVSLTFCIDL